jgi:hypothetical protein
MTDTYARNRLVYSEKIRNRWIIAIASIVLLIVALGTVWFLLEVFNG